MTDHIPCDGAIEVGQCFPLYLYDPAPPNEPPSRIRPPRRPAITPAACARFQTACPDTPLTHTDLFHYIYGLLHHPAYRTRFKNNLTRTLPRIPPPPDAETFRALRAAGQKLGDLHVNFCTATPFPVTFAKGDPARHPLAQSAPATFYRVTKMRLGGTARDKDRTTIRYNDHITLTGIPPAAWEYVVSGRPAIEWVMQRQGLRTDRKSGIVNDANAWARETMENPRYPLDLLCRVITISLETMKIVNTLPELEMD